jgi:hypothetical protein
LVLHCFSSVQNGWNGLCDRSLEQLILTAFQDNYLSLSGHENLAIRVQCSPQLQCAWIRTARSVSFIEFRPVPRTVDLEHVGKVSTPPDHRVTIHPAQNFCTKVCDMESLPPQTNYPWVD